jgi:hypothetical protein
LNGRLDRCLDGQDKRYRYRDSHLRRGSMKRDNEQKKKKEM